MNWTDKGYEMNFLRIQNSAMILLGSTCSTIDKKLLGYNSVMELYFVVQIIDGYQENGNLIYKVLFLVQRRKLDLQLPKGICLPDVLIQIAYQSHPCIYMLG